MAGQTKPLGGRPPRVLGFVAADASYPNTAHESENRYVMVSTSVAVSNGRLNEVPGRGFVVVALLLSINASPNVCPLGMPTRAHALVKSAPLLRFCRPCRSGLDGRSLSGPSRRCSSAPTPRSEGTASAMSSDRSSWTELRRESKRPALWTTRSAPRWKRSVASTLLRSASLKCSRAARNGGFR